MENIKQGSSNREQHPPAADSLSTHFYQYFNLVVADTPKLREEVYRIRYKVYCQELKYEREEDCWNGMEQDIYDQRSLHCLLMHRSSGLYAGCVRLVFSDPHALEALFPFEKACGYNVESNSVDLNNLPRYAAGEVSRLAVTAEFRKRPGEAQTEHGVSVEENELIEDERRRFPLIALGLYLAAIGIVLEAGLDGVFSVMEPRLARHLRRFGVPSRQIGGLVEYHGQRAPFHATPEEILNGLNPDVYELLQMIRSNLKMPLSPYFPSLLHDRAA